MPGSGISPRKFKDHGTIAAYVRGCRCRLCKDKVAKRSRDRRNQPGIRDRINEQARTNYDPKKRKDKHYRKRYGLTLDQWEVILQSQNYRCACCGTDDPRHSSGWVTDHNHQTGKIRAILCHPCNVTIGMLGDDIERARLRFFEIEIYLKCYS